jgi:hypothetical protein
MVVIQKHHIQNTSRPKGQMVGTNKEIAEENWITQDNYEIEAGPPKRSGKVTNDISTNGWRF